jgi:hypothetical protein
VDAVLSQIGAAFAAAPRPSDDALLHERCYDDNDIAALYGVAHWRDLGDDTVEREYAALSFLSPDGFRHFIAAYMGFALRHLGTGAAAVDSTIWALSPHVNRTEELREFARSKLAGFDAAQRAAAVAFLQAVRDRDAARAADAEWALAWWSAPPDVRG